MRIVEHRLEPMGLNVVANPLDHLPWRKRLAKGRDRAGFALGTDHIPLGT